MAKMALDQLFSSVSGAYIEAVACLLVTYTLYGAIWRLYLSPIAHIPGPRLAALTWWYEFYYDIVLGGQFVFKMRELHKQYGPIIRINPYEVHVRDPDFFPELYPGSHRRRDRWRFFTKQFGADGSGIGTVHHHHHRVRRAALNPFFSTQSVRALQPILESRVNALLARLRADGLSRPEVNILYPFSAFSNDVINEYAFARSDHLVEQPDYGRAVTDYLLTGTHYGKAIQHIPALLAIITALPDAVAAAAVPGWAGFLQMKAAIARQIAAIQATQHTARWALDVDHATIFHALLASPLLPPGEKTPRRLADEGQVLVQAATLTASWSLAVATFHLLDQPATLRRLRDELQAAIPDPEAAVPLAELEQLPYLRAVIKEMLRLSVGAAGRSARVCPDEALVFVDKGSGRRWVVPRGAAVSMTGFMTLRDEDIFPEPERFRAERWLEGTPEERQRLERYWVVFSGGTRTCLGMWLARAEITLALAKLWRVWGGEERRRGDVGRLRLAEGVEVRDAQMAADFYIPIPWKGTRGIRVVVETFA